MDLYARPLERVHGSALHGWGVAHGLMLQTQPNASLPRQDLVITLGTAIDGMGRHISLAFNGDGDAGTAELTKAATGAGVKANLIAVTATGLVFDNFASAVGQTPYAAGEYFVTLSWMETLDKILVGDNRHVHEIHTPHLYLQPLTENQNNSLLIILGRVTVGGDGGFTLVSSDGRRAASVPVGDYAVLQSLPDNGPNGAGLAITLPSPRDQLVVSANGGVDLAKVTLTTGQLAVARPSSAGLAISIPATSRAVSLGAADGGADLSSVDVASAQITVRSAGNLGVSIASNTGNKGIVASGDGTDVDLTVSGTLTATKLLSANGGLVLTGDLMVPGLLTANSGLAVNNAALNANAGLAVNNGAAVNGTFTANNGLTVSGAPLVANNALTVNNGAAINGTFAANNGLTVSGAPLIADGGMTVNNGATINGALVANNGATVSGELLTANNGLSVSNGATINGLLAATSGATVSGAALTVSNGLAVNGGATVGGLLSAGNGVSVSGGLSVNDGLVRANGGLLAPVTLDNGAGLTRAVNVEDWISLTNGGVTTLHTHASASAGPFALASITFRTSGATLNAGSNVDGSIGLDVANITEIQHDGGTGGGVPVVVGQRFVLTINFSTPASGALFPMLSGDLGSKVGQEHEFVAPTVVVSGSQVQIGIQGGSGGTLPLFLVVFGG